MEFIFICPIYNRVFESAAFRMDQNRGVQTDDSGNKFLDAMVVLEEPCPFCGEKHRFNASDLSCPFRSAKQG